jgi:hypothetical protein
MVGLITNKLDNVLIIRNLSDTNGGEAGIRTLGWIAPSIDFESIPFGHSGTSPASFREQAKN